MKKYKFQKKLFTYKKDDNEKYPNIFVFMRNRMKHAVTFRSRLSGIAAFFGRGSDCAERNARTVEHSAVAQKVEIGRNEDGESGATVGQRQKAVAQLGAVHRHKVLPVEHFDEGGRWEWEMNSIEICICTNFNGMHDVHDVFIWC